MRIGIIVHSHTGHTLGVAEKLMRKLQTEGHDVSLERVSVVDEDPNKMTNIQLASNPDIQAYEGLIFAAPVRGFSLSPVMKLYLSQLGTLNGKKVYGFVTQSFPFPWMGGNQSIKQLKRACQEKDVEVIETGIINWSNKNRESRIEELIEGICANFSA